MFNKQDNQYVKALLIDRSARLIKALHDDAPHSVLLSDCDEVQEELAKVTTVLEKIKNIEHMTGVTA